MVDAGLYVDGKRIATPPTVAEACAALRETEGAMAWIGLFRPTEAQFRPVAEEFGLHEVAVEDAIVAHQRPKLERYGDTLFVVLRAATYLDEEEEVEFGEIHVFVGPELRPDRPPQPDPGPRRRPPADGGEPGAPGPRARGGPVRDPRQRGRRLRAGRGRPQKDIDEIETQVFRGDPACRGGSTSCPARSSSSSARPARSTACSRRSRPASRSTARTKSCSAYLRDVADHATTVSERVAGFRQSLSDILTVNATLVNQAQNEEVKRLTGGEHRPERGGQAHLGLGRDHLRADAHRDDLRHELRHARAALGAGLPVRAGADGWCQRRAWLIFRRRGWL